MIEVNALRNGVTFEQDGELFKVLEYSHNKPGRGKATIRVKVRNLRSGTQLEKTFISGDRVQDVRLNYRQAQYLYKDGDFYTFMDMQTWEQPSISKDVLGDTLPFLIENLEVKLTFYETEPIEIELPTAVDLEVIESEFAVRGDTATGANKAVTVQTGLKVQVPLFVEVGNVIRVDTRDGSYVTRV